MRRGITHLIIVVYLGVLAYGLVAHTLQYKPYSSIAKYFIVWDMYCGYNPFEKRSLLVAEGESGHWYDVSPAWGDIRPFGSATRQDYDAWGIYSGRIAANTLRHTRHEPIVRVMLVEQLWSKKYNLPDSLWQRQFDEPKEPRSYYYIRSLFEPDGTLTTLHYDWRSNLAYHAISDNPALRARVAGARQHFVSNPFQTADQQHVQQTAFESPPR